MCFVRRNDLGRSFSTSLNGTVRRGVIKKTFSIAGCRGRRCFQGPIKLRLMLILVMKLAWTVNEEHNLWWVDVELVWLK